MTGQSSSRAFSLPLGQAVFATDEAADLCGMNLLPSLNTSWVADIVNCLVIASLWSRARHKMDRSLLHQFGKNRGANYPKIATGCKCFCTTNPLELPTSAGKADKCRPFTESAGRQAHPDAEK